jgi:hypothetical protein
MRQAVRPVAIFLEREQAHDPRVAFAVNAPLVADDHEFLREIARLAKAQKEAPGQDRLGRDKAERDDCGLLYQPALGSTAQTAPGVIQDVKLFHGTFSLRHAAGGLENSDSRILLQGTLVSGASVLLTTRTAE